MNLIDRLFPSLPCALIVYRAYANLDYYKRTWPDKLKAVKTFFHDKWKQKADVLIECNSKGKVVGTVMCTTSENTPADRYFPEQMYDTRHRFRGRVGYVDKFAITPGRNCSDYHVRLLKRVLTEWVVPREVEALILPVHPRDVNFYKPLDAKEIAYTCGTLGLEKSPVVLLLIDLRKSDWIKKIQSEYRFIEKT